MLMHPVYGAVRLDRAIRSALQPIDWFAQCAAVLRHPDRRLAVAALRDADPAHRAAVARRGAEGGGRDGRRRPLSCFVYHRRCRTSRGAITVVILIQTIFLLTVFAEILVTTDGGPGLRVHQHAFLVYAQALLQFDVGGASAGGIVAVVLANIVAFFLVRIVGKNLEG